MGGGEGKDGASQNNPQVIKEELPLHSKVLNAEWNFPIWKITFKLEDHTATQNGIRGVFSDSNSFLGTHVVVAEI